MELKAVLLEQLEREAEHSRRALEQVPEGRHDWKPHDASMIFGYLAMMVATIPSWVTMMINQPELDIAPVGGSQHTPAPMNTSAEYLAALDTAVASARTALTQTSDEHLQSTWKLLAGGTVAVEMPRYSMILDTLSHLSHHRGQMTVYLRLMGAKVPAVFGPSADDKRF